MTTFNTGNPIGSTDARDRLDNSENMDILENSTTLNEHPDRLGTMRKTRKGMELEHDNQIAAHETEFADRILKMAFTPVGTFTDGATLTDARQILLWEISDGGDGHSYSWAGSFGTSGKIVEAGSSPSPIAAGSWVDRTDDALRDEIRETVFQNMKRLYAEAGFNLVDGSFQMGGSLSGWPDVLWDWATGVAYQWHLDEAKPISAGSAPTNIGTDWIDLTVNTLRSEINIVQKRFACVADMVADSTLTVGQIVETLGYYNGWAATAAKPKGGNRYEIVTSSTGTADGGSFITLSNGLQAKALFIDKEIKAAQYGLKLDGSDDSPYLLKLLSNSTGLSIDFEGLVSSTTLISVTASGRIDLKNGGITILSGGTSYGVKILTAFDINLDNFVFDGDTIVCKPAYFITTGTSSNLTITGSGFKNAIETTTGLAAGIYATSNSGCYWNKVYIDDSYSYDITNAGIGTNVGRGFMIQNFKHLECSKLDVRRVAPYQDADGIYAASPEYIDGVFVCSDSYFEDCQKRSIKSQVKNSRVSNITARRTQYFTAAGGQAEVDLQAGGSLDGLTCIYADGSAPQSIVAGGYNNTLNTFQGVSFRNIDIQCEDSTDVIERIVTLFNNSSSVYDGFIAENIKCNAIITNLGYLYSSVGNASSSVYIFKDVLFRNIKASGMSSDSDVAVVQISRGATKYVRAIVRLDNCSLGDGTTSPIYYLDPTPGDTSYLEVFLRKIANCDGFNTKSTVNTDTKSRVYTQVLDIAENAAGNITVPISWTIGRSTIKILASYNSTRDSSASKLYTEGLYMYGNTTAYYIETLAGVKSQTNVGTIAVTTDGNNIILTKTAGTTSAGGRLTLMILHYADL